MQNSALVNGTKVAYPVFLLDVPLSHSGSHNTDKLWEGEGRGVAFVVLSDRSSQKYEGCVR